MTIEREYEELIQEELDGETSPSDTERLRRFLERSPEGRARRLEIENVFVALRRVPEVEPPADLRDTVLREIRALHGSQSPAAEANEGWFGTLRTLVKTRQGNRLAYAFAAGLLIGIVALSVTGTPWAPKWGGRESAVTGTMMPPAFGTTRGEWTAGQARVEAVTWRAGSDCLLRIAFRGDGSTTLAVSADGGAFAIRGVERSSEVSSLVVNGDRLEVEAQAGAVVTLRVTDTDSRPANFAFELASGSERVFGRLAAGSSR